MVTKNDTPIIEVNTITQAAMGRSSCGFNGSVAVWRTLVSSVLIIRAGGWKLMLSQQPPAKPSFIAWMPNLQDLDYPKVCVLSMTQILCLKE